MLKQNKIILKFILKFFIVYFSLLGIYSLFLHDTQKKTTIFLCDPITKTVANQTKYLADLFGYNIKTEQHNKELSVKIMIGDKFVARVIEGCNSISVIILFLAFIIAFSGKLMPTILFGLFGSMLIYTMNIVRIFLLSIAIYKYPAYQEVLHRLIFPAIIYGLVFILWIIWVNRYATIGKKKLKKIDE